MDASLEQHKNGFLAIAEQKIAQAHRAAAADGNSDHWQRVIVSLHVWRDRLFTSINTQERTIN